MGTERLRTENLIEIKEASVHDSFLIKDTDACAMFRVIGWKPGDAQRDYSSL
jgi:hypothetical protein